MNRVDTVGPPGRTVKDRGAAGVDLGAPGSISLINYSGMHTPLQRTIGHSPIMCGWQPWMKGRGCF